MKKYLISTLLLLGQSGISYAAEMVDPVALHFSSASPSADMNAKIARILELREEVKEASQQEKIARFARFTERGITTDDLIDLTILVFHLNLDEAIKLGFSQTLAARVHRGSCDLIDTLNKYNVLDNAPYAADMLLTQYENIQAQFTSSLKRNAPESDAVKTGAPKRLRAEPRPQLNASQDQDSGASASASANAMAHHSHDEMSDDENMLYMAKTWDDVKNGNIKRIRLSVDSTYPSDVNEQVDNEVIEASETEDEFFLDPPLLGQPVIQANPAMSLEIRNLRLAILDRLDLGTPKKDILKEIAQSHADDAVQHLIALLVALEHDQTAEKEMAIRCIAQALAIKITQDQSVATELESQSGSLRGAVMKQFILMQYPNKVVLPECLQPHRDSYELSLEDYYAQGIDFSERLKTVKMKLLLDLSHLELTSLEGIERLLSMVPTKNRALRGLNLSHNALKEIPQGCFTTISQLYDLDLSFNGITQISSHTFAGLTSLTNLELSNNLISLIEQHGISGLPQLFQLHLGKNFLPCILENMLQDLKGLTHLYLQNNQLTRFCPSALPKLKFLDLSHNYLAHLNAGHFASCAQLTELNLANNMLTRLLADTFSGLNYVKWIYLESNSLEEIEDNAFANLPAFIYLTLGHNRLKSLPKNFIRKIPTLQELHLGRNQFSTLENLLDGAVNITEVSFDAALLQTLGALPEGLDEEKFTGKNSTTGVNDAFCMLKKQGRPRRIRS